MSLADDKNWQSEGDKGQKEEMEDERGKTEKQEVGRKMRKENLRQVKTKIKNKLKQNDSRKILRCSVLKQEVECLFSETLVVIYQTTGRHITKQNDTNLIRQRFYVTARL